MPLLAQAREKIRSFDRKQLKKYLRVATDIVHKLPDRNDNWFKIAVKLMAIADSFDKTQVGTNSQLFDFFEKLEAKSIRNAQFVDMFFETPLIETFEIRRIMISDYADVVLATDDILGTLYFVEYKWGPKPEPSTDFWHSTGFNFEGALERLWDIYRDGLHISLKYQANLERPRTDYRTLIPTQDPVVGRNTLILESLVKAHAKYSESQIPRTYLFLGMQGVGKSTLATRMAKACGKRTLRIDARGLTTAGTNDLHFLLMGLRPDFLILDDVDRVVSEAVPMLLEGLSDLKERYPNVTTILTANDVSPFDAAILRPGRIDQIIEFEPPDAEERRAILWAYIEQFGSPRPNKIQVNQLLSCTQGYSAVYMREVALELKASSVEEIVETQKQRKRLTEKAKSAGGPGAKEKGPEPSTKKVG